MGFLDTMKNGAKGAIAQLGKFSPAGKLFKDDDTSIAANLARGDMAGAIGASKSHAGDRAAAKQQEIEGRENDQYGKNQEYNKQLGSADDDYLKSMTGNTSKYQGDLDQLRGEVEDSQKDARNTYTNTTQPRLKDLMESAQKNSAGAMSLQDAMDPNNKVATATRKLYTDQAAQQRGDYNTEGAAQRDLYNQQGQKIQGQYESQAQNEGKKGLADVGVLQALGMQNMAGQLGNVPMTGGQLQALMGANSAQSGAAYAQTQRRLQSLRDQGLQGNLDAQNQGLGVQSQARMTGLGRASDLQNQGLSQGFNRSDTAYNQGLQAQDRYRSSIGDVESASDRQQSRDEGFRGQRGDLSNKSYGLQQAMNDATRGVNQSKTTRDMAIMNQHLGGQQANAAGQIAQINAGETQRGQLAAGAMQAAGTVGGAFVGGPGGAALGNQAGKAAGQANMPQQASTPQYGNYNSPYGATSQPSNFVESGSVNQGYGGVSGVYGSAGGAYPSSGVAGQGPGQGAPGLGLTDDQGFQGNPYAYTNRQAMDKKRRS